MVAQRRLAPADAAVARDRARADRAGAGRGRRQRHARGPDAGNRSPHVAAANQPALTRKEGRRSSRSTALLTIRSLVLAAAALVGAGLARALLVLARLLGAVGAAGVAAAGGRRPGRIAAGRSARGRRSLIGRGRGLRVGSRRESEGERGHDRIDDFLHVVSFSP